MKVLRRCGIVRRLHGGLHRQRGPSGRIPAWGAPGSISGGSLGVTCTIFGGVINGLAIRADPLGRLGIPLSGSGPGWQAAGMV